MRFKSPYLIHNQRGSSALFFAVVMVPVLLFIASLTLDITKYYRETQRVQQIIDETTLHAVRYLPYQHKTKQIIEDALSRYDGIINNSTISVSPDVVSVSYQGSSELSIAKLFVPDAAVSLSVYSEARLAPRDVYLALDASSYLGPENSESPWGLEQDWPSASFFRNEFSVTNEGTYTDPRIITQLCFNPAFSALKQALISLFEYFSGSHLDAVGVGVFPGADASGLFNVREIRLSNEVLSDGGQAHFQAEFVRPFGGDALCAAAASREHSHNAYMFPNNNASISGLWNPKDKPTNMVLSNPWRLNPEYQAALSVQEAAWSAMRRPWSPITDRILTSVATELLAARFDNSREKTATISKRVAIILAADLPHTVVNQTATDGSILAIDKRFPDPEASDAIKNGLQGIIPLARAAEAEGRPLEIVYVILQHDNSPADLEVGSQRLQEFFNTIGADDTTKSPFVTKVIVAASPESLVQEVTASLVLSGRSTLVSK